MRYRVDDRRTSAQVVYTDTNADCTNQQVSTVYHPGYLGTKRETWDVVTPNYHKRRRAGEIIVNPYKHLEESWFNTGDGTKTRSPANACANNIRQEFVRVGAHLTKLCEDPANAQTHGRLTPNWVLTQSDVDRTIDLASTKAWSDAAGSEAQLLVFIAELHKTMKLLLNPLGNLSKFLKKVLRDKHADPRPSVKALTCAEYLVQEWLTYRFGIRPLLFDLQSIVKAIQKDRKSGLVRAKGSSTLERNTLEQRTINHGSQTTTYELLRIHKLEVKAGFLHRAELKTPDYLGLQIKDIPAAIWELIPFSFVIDWFFGVGDWVKSLVPFASTPTLGAFTTVTHTITVQRTAVGTTQTADATASGWLLDRQMSGSEILIQRSKERFAWIRPPSIVNKISISDFDFSDKRIIDAFALVFQQLKAK